MASVASGGEVELTIHSEGELDGGFVVPAHGRWNDNSGRYVWETGSPIREGSWDYGLESTNWYQWNEPPVQNPNETIMTTTFSESVGPDSIVTVTALAPGTQPPGGDYHPEEAISPEKVLGLGSANCVVK